ncbi:unnamed protein product [Psylliodes chrysocephalus]|uniref:DNA repair protein RAD50 n=1 Tax=Psylliodes chrysocephalus TaxID=3402493 RepID=A0A9P0D7E5_9CUCU|nr:unnamed protein product [Psylliodes chrysocephala]
MALLRSLEIIGIRNFSPEDKQTIYFGTPVVLFQGQNGSGKTTIIESIRYALTGELPTGTDHGKGFVNEPKMSNKSTTKGSIKIKFSDTEGNVITVAKVVQVQLIKSGNLSFKRLNYAVRRRDKDTGDVQDISGRCIDIDSYCCNTLNVSKAIFNNVLFCHQENSLWPLDEPKKLKEKFDEIFDATKYNRCIKNIRDYIKAQQIDVKSLHRVLDSKKEIKNRVEHQRAKFEERKVKLGETKEAIKTKKKEMEPLTARMNVIMELEEKLGNLQRKLTGKEEEKKGLANQQSTLISSMSYVFEGSDEDLQSKINSFKDEQTSEESSIRKLEKNVQDTTIQIGTLNRTVQNKQVKIGQLKEEQNNHNSKLQESQNLIEKLRVELDIPTNDDKEYLIGELSKSLKDEQKKLADLKREKDVEEKLLQDQIDKIREQNAGTKQSISSKKTAISDYKSKLRDIQGKLQELDTSDTQLKAVTDKIQKWQQTLSSIKNSFDEHETLQEIDTLKEQIGTKEQYLDKLDKEYRILQRNYVTEQKLESERASIVEMQGQINKIKSRHSDNLKMLFNDDVPKKNLERAVVDIQKKQDAEFNRLTQNISNLERELTTLQTTLNHQKNKLKTDQQELANNKRKIDKLCNGTDFTSFLDETYKKKESVQKRKGYLSAAKIVFENLASKFESEKSCPVCQTSFSNNTSALPAIIEELKHRVVLVPGQLAQTENEFKKVEVLYNNLQQLKIVNDDIATMSKTKIPKLEQEISNLTEQHEETNMVITAEKANLERPKMMIEICKNLIRDATLFDKYQTDIAKANDNIEELQETIEKVSSKRSHQETEMEIDSVKRELSNTKNRYDSSKDLLDGHRERCQDLNKKIQTEVQKQIDIQKLVQEKPLLEKQNAEYKEQIDALNTEIEDLQLNLASLENDLREAVDKKNKATKTNREHLDKVQNKLISYQNALSDIHKLEMNIQDYQRKNNGAKFEKAMEELAQLTITLENLEKNKTKIQSAISEKKEAIAKKESEFRALKDNVTLREKRRQEDAVAVEIDNLKLKIGDYNYRQVFEEKTKKSTEIDKKLREINILQGQLEEVQAQHDELEYELDKPENKNAYKNYKKQHYELIAKNLCIADLDKYVKVLERSVLKFHEERMVQINRMVRNLWRTIYKGNDIDYIEIKTDDSIDGGANKRKYSYKVVQVKNGIELDMRGRCSAGQKVLACLVIRMALAETFSSNCGILALDEPTTNLDRANISSLSDALSGLINSRENQSHFQLLIITHDEDFLRSITQGQSIDSYWQVKRSDSGSSTVERKML